MRCRVRTLAKHCQHHSISFPFVWDGNVYLLHKDVASVYAVLALC